MQDETKKIALLGNPNVGKSTVFNSLTGMKQHTGNWPGKTVDCSMGRYEHKGKTYDIYDLPGTYSLIPHSKEEEVVRDFICYEEYDAIVVVCDAVCLERNLNLALQVMSVCKNVVICVNLMDEAEKKMIKIDLNGISKELNVPVIGMVARSKIGLEDLKDVVQELISRKNVKYVNEFCTKVSDENTTQFVRSLPREVIADTGLDVLTHGIEAYVSVMATDYTDALALKAIEMVFEYLPKSYKNDDSPECMEAREKMHNASCMAGMAFANAFLGINHSLAHKLGSHFNIPHGRANAILLPHVIEYNSQIPTKITAFSKYKNFVADKKYSQISKVLGLKSNNIEEGVKSLISAIENLMKELNEPTSIAKCGIDKEKYFDLLEQLSLEAFDDQCTSTNPRQPMISEIKAIYEKIY